MLLLLFHLGPDLHALDAAQVVEVLALVELAPLHGAPVGVAGLLNHRGTEVPVVDLCQIVLGRPAQRRLSTRIILARCPTLDGERVLGLIAEHATETLRQDDRPDYLQWDASFSAAPWMDTGAENARGLIQIMDVPSLVPGELRHFLFSSAPAIS